jgi:hypothetical protein
MYQTTIKVEAFVTVTTKEPITATKDIPMYVEVYTEDYKADTGHAMEMHSCDIISKEVSTVVEI